MPEIFKMWGLDKEVHGKAEIIDLEDSVHEVSVLFLFRGRLQIFPNIFQFKNMLNDPMNKTQYNSSK